jgi:hypothetical protein
VPVLEAGERIPDARVWTAPRKGPVALCDAIAGDGPALLSFYLWNWSPT